MCPNCWNVKLFVFCEEEDSRNVDSRWRDIGHHDKMEKKDYQSVMICTAAMLGPLGVRSHGTHN